MSIYGIDIYIYIYIQMVRKKWRNIEKERERIKEASYDIFSRSSIRGPPFCAYLSRTKKMLRMETMGSNQDRNIFTLMHVFLAISGNRNVHVIRSSMLYEPHQAIKAAEGLLA